MDELLLEIPDAVVIVDERPDYEIEETEPFYGIDANYQKEQKKIRYILIFEIFWWLTFCEKIGIFISKIIRYKIR